MQSKNNNNSMLQRANFVNFKTLKLEKKKFKSNFQLTICICPLPVARERSSMFIALAGFEPTTPVLEVEASQAEPLTTTPHGL
jgi:hypothetical protein